MPLDIRPAHLKIVLETLNRFIPDREVWVFGSRVKGTAKDTSDLDLAVIGKTPLDFKTLAALRDDFSESNIPYKVDVVDWSTISETFREIIRKDRVVIHKGIDNGLGTKGLVFN
ncbi:MAG: nucleotidyltransferase family protein [Leptospirales bacterium]